MIAPTVTVRGVTYAMQPVSGERWAAMRASHDRTFERTEAAYADRYPPLLRHPTPSQFSETWGT